MIGHLCSAVNVSSDKVATYCRHGLTLFVFYQQPCHTTTVGSVYLPVLAYKKSATIHSINATYQVGGHPCRSWPWYTYAYVQQCRAFLFMFTLCGQRVIARAILYSQYSRCLCQICIHVFTDCCVVGRLLISIVDDWMPKQYNVYKQNLGLDVRFDF